MMPSIKARIDSYFGVRASGSSLRTEALAGTTTFLTMAYIIFVQPTVLSGRMFGQDTGMDFGAVTVATCLAAMLATLLMGFYARYPVALAPGMGANFFFVLTVIPAAAATAPGQGWQIGLGVIFISGLLFLLITLTGLREAVMNAISPDLKNGIAVGIGLFIAFVGLQNTRLIVSSPGTSVSLNTNFASPDIIVFFVGLIVTSALHVRRVPGSILLGIIFSTLLSVLARYVIPHLPEAISTSPVVLQSMLMTDFRPVTKLVSHPPSLAPTFMAMDLTGAFALSMIPYIVIFLFIDLFDTMGTLVAISHRAGLVDSQGSLPRANQAFLADAAGTVVGAGLGTSTVTSFIESAAGVEQGGRTGLTAIVTGLFFLLALFFTPAVNMVGSYTPITAPALVIVGAMMLQNIAHIDLANYAESIPAFIIMLGIPLSYSIADGIALGLISYPAIKLLSGRGREVSWIMYVLGVLMLFYFPLLRAGL